MKEELRIDIVGLAGACSYALDCIEAELVKIKNKHGKRVAYISVCMAEYLAIQGDALQDLAMCALLHDNALTQYITEELERKFSNIFFTINTMKIRFSYGQIFFTINDGILFQFFRNILCQSIIMQ